MMDVNAEDTVGQGRPDVIGLQPGELESRLREHVARREERDYRVRQLLPWVYEKDAMSFEEMTDLPTDERAALAASFDLTAPVPARTEVSSDGTVKHLWRLEDGELIESVLIPAADRLTLCISSQAGCAQACVFCATGWSGFQRHLTTAEIVAQFRGARRYADEHDMGPITNVVFMGMGEPLANRKAVMPALTLLNHGYQLGARRVTVSTVGVVPGILEMANRPEQFRLALSLHAPNHELREKLVPIEKKYPLPELMEALREFDAAGRRRITFEYVMIDGVNDDPALVAELAELAGEIQAHVNLIPFNPVPGTGWAPSPADRLQRFATALDERGINVTLREPRGRDIAAACGQLRAEHVLRPPKTFVRLKR
jgi:23S rRNA (adenine2503-C2)-methyltransferase